MLDHCLKRGAFWCIICIAALATTQCVRDNSGTPGGDSDGSGGNTDTVVTDGYVDLGLRSMTVWKATNEVNEACDGADFYTYDEAIATFGDKLPTKEQFEELVYSCQWVWMGIGYRVIGPSGKSILLPAAGSRDCNGNTDYVRTYGFYWTSTPDYNPDHAWYLTFYSDEIFMYKYNRCYGNSVRLVKDVQDY